MIQPYELTLHLPVVLDDGIKTTTTRVWEVLQASYVGDLEKLKSLVHECPQLCYAQYNYTPPIHFAVREGHVELVKYLLSLGAYAPEYKTYPFLESLEILAADRGHQEILNMLQIYSADNTFQKFQGDNGEIFYERTELEKKFEKAVYEEDLDLTEKLLQQDPSLVHDKSFFWSEGILLFAAKENNRPMIDLLMHYGATVPSIVKWAQFYYLEHDEGAPYMLKKGMNANTMSWQKVTLLHDMAQKGNISKAELLIKHGAEINAVDEEYQSTPLGMAARWGHATMVKFLLEKGADPKKSGAEWSVPINWAKTKGHNQIVEMLSTEK